MVKRYIKRKGKTYGPYHYKSKRIGKQVKSIYVGKEVNGKVMKRKNSKKVHAMKITGKTERKNTSKIEKTNKKTNKNMNKKVNRHVHEFKLLLKKADTLLIENRVAEAMQVYTELTNLYKKIKDPREKLELYERARMIYERIKLQSV